jgi:hypothetical protein
MTPDQEVGLRYPQMLEDLAAGDPLARILLADDWQPIETYRPSTDYVFIKYCDAALNPGKLAVSSRGWHPNSSWYSIAGLPLSISPYAWKPIDWSGHESWRAYLDVLWPPPPWCRPQEQVFEPGPIDVRLTDEPFKLLRLLCNGSALKELIGTEWDPYRIQHGEGRAWDKITCRPVDRLAEQAFIERIGTLPPARPRKLLTYTWRVTDAGRSWLAANPTGWKKPAKKSASATRT